MCVCVCEGVVCVIDTRGEGGRNEEKEEEGGGV